MATCPKCETLELNPGMMSPGLPALACESCAGALVSLLTYRAWRESRDLSISSTPTSKAPNNSHNNYVACLCPKCGALMSKYRFSQHTDDQLDFCAHCQEVWFDDGEWAVIEDLALSVEFTQIFTQPWQYSLRRQKIESETAARWEARLGPDFETLQKTKQWLDSHPNKNLMLNYLNSAQH